MKRYKYNTFFLIIFCLFHLGMSFAQNTDFDAYRKQKQQEWNTYTNAKQKEYAEYRNKLNAAYAERMKTSWKPFQLSAAKPIPKQPEPPTPTVKPDDEKAPTQPLPVKEVVKPIVPESPKPVKPIARPEQEEVPLYTFKYHNTTCNIHLQKNQAFSLSNVSEASAAAAWKQMSNNGFDIVADDCLKHKEQLALNDWGYIELTKALACSFLGKGNSEAVLMQAYLLVQSGYKIRLAKGNNRLVLMIPFSDELYDYSFMYLNGERYYLMSDDKRGGSYSVFTEKFEGEKTPSLSLQREPQFADNPMVPKTFASARFPAVTTSVSSNKNLIEFYNTYPITSHWNEYAKASLSKRAKRSLYPMLKKQIAGKTSLQAANILLNFVQTAFDYKTDQEQFGYERPLFGDEIFYYPYSDCEDRSILFSILVRELLKLDVVMLHYPGHLATAVHFPDEVSGYYFIVKNKKYVVCDPTYIGAPVGDCMPQFVGTSATIIEI